MKPLTDPTELPPNPYAHIDDDQASRINADVLTSDLMRIKAISPRHGTIQTIVNLYVKSIVTYLDELGITHYSDENLAKFRSLILRHTHPSLVGQVATANDSSGKAGVHESHSDAANKSANPPGDAGKGGKGRAKKVTKE